MDQSSHPITAAAIIRSIVHRPTQVSVLHGHINKSGPFYVPPNKRKVCTDDPIIVSITTQSTTNVDSTCKDPS